MRIVGIGVDIEQIAKTEFSISRYGESWLKRQFTDFEIEQAPSAHSAATYFTVLFAAKEAVSKALGNGIDEELPLLSMEIRCEGLMVRAVSFHHSGKSLAQHLEVEDVHLSAFFFNEHVMATALAVGS